MEVTKSNFAETLPRVKRDIDRATFLAIDCELTGLNTKFDVNAYDTPSQYYAKLLANSRNFSVVQFGLCTFRYCADEKTFRQQCYNFYVFPSVANGYVPDRRFLCQPSSLEFLSRQDFDFNKLIREGIPYLNLEERNEYRRRLDEKQNTRLDTLNSTRQSGVTGTPNLKLNTTVADKEKIDKIFEEIENFLNGDETERLLPSCNSFIRRNVYNEAETRLKNRATLLTRPVENSKDKQFLVTRWKNDDDKLEANKRLVDEENATYQTCIGFSEVIEHIVNSHKLIVGHNMLLDVFHCVDKFLTQIPQDYVEFKDVVHGLFGKILDTKFMCNSAPFKDVVNSSVLPHLVETMQSAPFEIPSIEIESDGQGYSLKNSKEHEAGYDAFITGMCLVTMWNRLETTGDPYENESLLDPYINRLHLMKIFDDPYMYLGEQDPVPKRDHVLHLEFSKDWKTNDIFQLFGPYGPVHVAWIDQTSAYVGLHRRNHVKSALQKLSKESTVNKANWRISTYVEHQQKRDGNELEALTPTPKKRKLSNSNLKQEKTVELEGDDEDVGVPVARMEVVEEEEPVVAEPEEEKKTEIWTTVVNRKKAPKSLGKAAKGKKRKKVFEVSDDWE